MWGRALLALGSFAVVGGAVVGGLLLRSALASDDRFRIAGASNIESAGLAEVSRADLLPVFGEDIGKNIFFINLQQRRHEIEAIPWVKHATVMRVLPNHLRVAVEERQPVAFTQINGETGLVDADGVLLTMSAAAMAERHYSFPEVTGVTPAQSAGERRARLQVYTQMMSELDAGGQHNSQQISEVDLSDPEDARVKMADQSADIVAHLGYEHFLDRYQRYMRHIGEWRQQYPHLIGVDLRYKGQVVLKRAAASEAQEASAKPAAATSAAGQPAAVKMTAAKVAAPEHKQGAAKIAGKNGSAKAKNAPQGANSHAGKAKVEKQKNETARAIRARAEKQRKHEAERHAPVNAVRHSTPVLRPVPVTVEGQ
jgi:cell division protein FtsQ